MKNKTKLKVILFLILLFFAIFCMIFLPKILKSQGQGDGLPEIISGLTFLVISPTIILFSLLGLFNLLIKNEYVLIGGIYGITFGAVFSIFGKTLLIPFYYVSALIFYFISTILNYKCSGECGEGFIFMGWINLLIFCIIGMFLGYIYSNKRKNFNNQYLTQQNS